MLVYSDWGVTVSYDILTGSHCILGYSDRESFCTGVTQSYDTGARPGRGRAPGPEDRPLLATSHAISKLKRNGSATSPSLRSRLVSLHLCSPPPRCPLARGFTARARRLLSSAGHSRTVHGRDLVHSWLAGQRGADCAAHVELLLRPPPPPTRRFHASRPSLTAIVL